MDQIRVDRWLWAARLYKTRALAQEACAGGHVKVNGISVKPSRALRIGDELHAQAPRGPVVLKVRGLAEKRLSPPLARELYEDHSPPPPPREPFARPVRTGRPTKADRRALDRFKRGL